VCHAGFSIRVRFKKPEKGVAADKSEKRPVSCGMFVEVNKKWFYWSRAIRNLRGIGNHAVRFIGDDVGGLAFLEESRMPGGLLYELPPMHGSPLHQKNAGENHHGASMPQRQSTGSNPAPLLNLPEIQKAGRSPA